VSADAAALAHVLSAPQCFTLGILPPASAIGKHVRISMRTIRTASHAGICMPLILALLLLLPVSAEAQARQYRILISNDDGVLSDGIAALAAELSGFAEIVVVAPAEDESGASHRSVIRTQTTTLTRVEKDGQLFGYSVDASPSDAVKFGLLHFGDERPFDLVVSGINAGANVGFIAHSSGTVGAAMEGLLNGVPSIAVSQGSRPDFELSARFAADFVRQVLERGSPPGVLLSVNIPAGEIKGVRAAPMGGFYFRVSDMIQSSDAGDTTEFRARVSGATGVEPGSDSALYLDGYITITPLRIDWTDEATMRDLESWGLRVDGN
jgi:5'-nucleotidase